MRDMKRIEMKGVIFRMRDLLAMRYGLGVCHPMSWIQIRAHSTPIDSGRDNLSV